MDRGTVGRAALVAAVRPCPSRSRSGCVPASRTWSPSARAGSTTWGLKATVWSWAPYAVCFGLLPAVVTLSLPGSPRPAWWAMAAGALLGVGAHLANVLPDLEDDRATASAGCRTGSAGRARPASPAWCCCSRRRSWCSRRPGARARSAGRRWPSTTLLALAGTLVALRTTGSRLPFLLTIAVAAVDVVLLLSSGASLLA